MPALPQTTKNPNLHKINHETFADDAQNMQYFKPNTSTTIIKADLRSRVEYFINESAKINFTIADNKSFFMTNRIARVRQATSEWSTWEVKNSCKLVGLRFKLEDNLNISWRDQFEYAYERFQSAISKLKFTVARNKFIGQSEMIQLYKAYCQSLIDYGNIVTVYNNSQMEKFDKFEYKSIKHMINIKRTTLTANIRITFDLPRYEDRMRTFKLNYFLKHVFYIPVDANAVSCIMKHKSWDELESIFDNIMPEGFILVGMYENALEKKLIKPFDISQSTNFGVVRGLFRNSKIRIFANTIISFILEWFKKMLKYHEVVSQFNYNGDISLVDMKVFLSEMRTQMLDLGYSEGKNLINNHTAFFLAKHWDLDSRNNFLYNHNDRELNRRSMKLFFMTYRLNYRIAIVVNDLFNCNVCNGRCVMCDMDADENELHFLLDCPFYENIKSQTFNSLLAYCPQLDLAVYLRYFDLLLFGSYEMISRLLPMDIRQWRKFSYEMKKCVNSMTLRRVQQMILMTEADFEGRFDVEDAALYRQYLLRYEYLY